MNTNVHGSPLLNTLAALEAELHHPGAVCTRERQARVSPMRMSIWVHTSAGWQLRCHQGTPATAES
jgi:hypothetical protein